MKVITVGMADLKVTQSPNRLRTTGLGSCVGVVLYDERLKIAGMAHVMLPSSSLSKGVLNVAKYADTAIPQLIAEMKKMGSRQKDLIAKLAGGAQMFSFSGGADLLRIGPRNVEACKTMLQKALIPIVFEDTGGNHGRTIEMDAQTGILTIRTVNRGVKEG
ncbi:chemoreceptor glutamine deamidase CheD [Bacillaceae bacterium]